MARSKKTITRCLLAKQPGPITVVIDAGFVFADIIANPDCVQARAVITGPRRPVRRVRARTRRNGTWRIKAPDIRLDDDTPMPGTAIRVIPASQLSAGTNAPGAVTMTVVVPPGSTVDAVAGPRHNPTTDDNTHAPTERTPRDDN